MYCDTNFKTKKAMKQAVHEHIMMDGPPVTTHQPGGMFPGIRDGEATIEGPHYPQPHRWYARVMLRGGAIVKVIS